MRYYRCINCGHVGDYGFDRKRSVVCQHCEWDILSELDLEEYLYYTTIEEELEDESEPKGA